MLKVREVAGLMSSKGTFARRLPFTDELGTGEIVTAGVVGPRSVKKT